MTQLASTWPSVCKVPSLIPGDITSKFLLFSFLSSFDSLKTPLKQKIDGEKGVKDECTAVTKYQSKIWLLITFALPFLFSLNLLTNKIIMIIYLS